MFQVFRDFENNKNKIYFWKNHSFSYKLEQKGRIRACGRRKTGRVEYEDFDGGGENDEERGVAYGDGKGGKLGGTPEGQNLQAPFGPSGRAGASSALCAPPDPSALLAWKYFIDNEQFAQKRWKKYC